MCDGSHDCIMNVTITSFSQVEKMLVYITIKMPEDETDKTYRKEFMKSTFDVSRILNGIYGSPVVSVFMSNFLKSCDFELKMPFPPVKVEVKSLITLLKDFFQRTYHITNLVVNNLFPVLVESLPGIAILRFVGKIAGSKQPTFFCEMQFRGKLTAG